MKLLLSISAAVTGLLLGSWAWAGEIRELAREFESGFQAALQEENVPGGAFAIVYQGEILRLGTFGHTDMSREQAVGPGTAFRLASVSKGFAATLAALQVDEGLFQWQEPITRFKPEFRFRKNGSPITVHDVVGNSTGFTPHAFDHLIEASVPLKDIYGRFESLDPVCNPGTCYTYQNSAFALIEAVVEAATGSPYDLQLEDRIFRPLNMNGASVGYERFLATTDRAHPHVRSQQNWQKVEVKPTYYAINSAAGINASATDMAQWLIALLGHRPDVLPHHVVDEVVRPRVHTPRRLNNRYWRGFLNDAHYGLGWRIYRVGNHELAYHGGWVSGFRADAAFSRAHDLGLVILLNAESNVISELSSWFWSRALDDTLVADRELPGSAPRSGGDTVAAPSP